MSAEFRIRIGCCGWPVGRAGYFQRFTTVEINSTFYNPPRMVTAHKWATEAPEGFEFSVKAWQLITHPPTSPTYKHLTQKLSDKALERCGHFKDSSEVTMGWERTQAAARLLKAKFILFQTPASFYPNANHLRDMYRFFKGIPRRGMQYVWEPRGEAWSPKMIRKVCEDIGLVHGVDPFVTAPLRGSVCYFRLHGAYNEGRIVSRHEYSDAELRTALEHCGDKPAYVYFNNISMWRDARRFQDMAQRA